MTALQKIIHAQVTKGQISITEKTRGGKGTWHLQGGEQGARLRCPEPKIKATKWPFQNSWPSPFLTADTSRGCTGPGELRALLAGR